MMSYLATLIAIGWFAYILGRDHQAAADRENLDRLLEHNRSLRLALIEEKARGGINRPVTFGGRFGRSLN